MRRDYRVEVVARCDIDPQGQTLQPAALDAVVNTYVIEPLDHKHLNHDVPRFADRNPSVEHIAEAVWDMLAEPLSRELPGSTLDEISVWETGKTVCTYHGPAATPTN